MKAAFRPLRMTILFTVVVMAGCASGPTIIANQAPGFSLANVRTFDFMDPLGTDRDGTRTLMSTFMMASTTRELEARGLTRDSNNPDLLVNFVVSTRETISSRPSAGTSVSFRGSRYGTWGGYSMGVSTSTNDIVQRTEGSVAIDLVDRASNTLVWEGVARGRVTDRDRENLQPALDAAVTQILARL